MLGSGGWAIEIYHRRVQKSKLSCPAPRYRTAAMHQTSWRGRWLGPGWRTKKKAGAQMDCSFFHGSGSWARTSGLIVNSDPLYH